MRISILCGAALAAVCFSATAQNTFTIYGVADVGVDFQRVGAAGSIPKLSSGTRSGSRLGFKGAEDLGDGLTALVVLEMGIALDTGAPNQGGLAFGRQALIGLKYSYGALTLGRQYTAVNNALCGDIDPFACGLARHAGNLMSVGGTPTNVGSGSQTNNAIKLASNDIRGFTGEFTYSPGEVGGSSRAGRKLRGLIGFTQSGLTLRVAHKEVAAPNNASTAKVTFMGAKYDFVTGSLGYAINKGAFSANTNIANPASRDFLIGIAVPVGAGRVIASYVKKSDRAGSNDASQAAVGYTYLQSKRTNLYTAHAHINNAARNSDKAAFYTVGNAIDCVTCDSAFNLGIRHSLLHVELACRCGSSEWG